MDDTIKIIRVLFISGISQRFRAAGWYRWAGQLTLYTIRAGKRRTVAEFDERTVTALWDIACESGKAAE